MNSNVHFAVCFLAILAAPACGANEFRDVSPGDRPQFPQSFFYQPDYRVQWWYVTGTLIGEQLQEYGFEVTFFVAGVQRREWRSQFALNNLYVSHFALTDVAANRFYTDEQISRGAFGLAGASTDTLHLWVGENRLTGTPDKMSLRAITNDIDLFLTLTPRKPPVLHGDTGYSRKAADSPGHASLYFSLTNLDVEGVLGVGDFITTVEGRAWFDREIFSQGHGADQAGWDWFSLRLDDGREIMLYQLRQRDGGVDPYSAGTIIEADGATHRLAHSDFSINVLAHWTSPKTRARYPSRWRIRVPTAGLDVTVVPLVADQEFDSRRSTGNVYWEGLCAIEGAAPGRAYVELTGYAP